MELRSFKTVDNQDKIDELCINTIRTLSMDAVQKADSGHPGTPMALAPLAYVLWTKFLLYNPNDPQWFDRDRFILSCGHASLLQYTILHLAGYEISLNDIKNFRQWGSNTPGHPEYLKTPGVDITTGPLGQGIMCAVGMAIAEAHLAAIFNQPEFKIVDHRTYCFCSDGDLMEGASHEAASIAGHQKLGKLICVYDDNHISIEGQTELTFSDDVAKRFEAYHWHVQNIGDKANDLPAITEALNNAVNENQRPSLIIIRSHIGYGAPHLHDTKEAHGQALGEEEVRLAKKFYNWPEDKFFYEPQEVLDYMNQAIQRGKELQDEWNEKFKSYEKQYPSLAEMFKTFHSTKFAENWDKDIPEFKTEKGPMATRSASGKVLNAIAPYLPWLCGGSGDLSPSTKTLIDKSGYFEPDHHQDRNFAWGVREHAMCGCSNGISLHGGLRPYASTFFIFTDYARPSIRLACIMELPVIYIMTHDSIGLGEDGPTHQPIEHLASFRAMPNMYIIRPADANETAYAWRAALARTSGPTMLVLTRQNVPIFDRTQYQPASGTMKGAYIISKEKGPKPQLILIASGSEVQLIIEAQKQLYAQGIDARAVSMPCWELFMDQPQKYRNQILPPRIKNRIAIEAGSSFGWCKWVQNEANIIAIDKFGASAPYQEIYKHYGLTVENIIAKAKELLA
jgi:transketolase